MEKTNDGQLEGQLSIFDIWAPKKYPGVQNIYEYVNHPNWMNKNKHKEVEEWLQEHPEDIDSYKASKMLKRNEYPAIIKSLVSELIEMFGDDAISEPFTYDVWEHVPNLGARLFIVIDNQTQWDLTEIISRYKKVNLEIDPTECPGDEEGKEDIYISTMWTTPKHKENLDEAPLKDTFPWNYFETDNGLHFPPEKKAWTVYEIIREYRQHKEQRLERIRYRNATFIGLEKNPYPMDDNKIIMWREVPEQERVWRKKEG